MTEPAAFVIWDRIRPGWLRPGPDVVVLRQDAKEYQTDAPVIEYARKCPKRFQLYPVRQSEPPWGVVKQEGE